MTAELVKIQFLRRANLVGGAMYLPGEIACVSSDIAAQLCEENDNPAATFYRPKVLDAPPLNKMQASAEHKKGSHG